MPMDSGIPPQLERELEELLARRLASLCMDDEADRRTLLLELLDWAHPMVASLQAWGRWCYSEEGAHTGSELFDDAVEGMGRRTSWAFPGKSSPSSRRRQVWRASVGTIQNYRDSENIVAEAHSALALREALEERIGADLSSVIIFVEDAEADLPEPELTVKVSLRRLSNTCWDQACEHFGLNPYCLNEGADPEATYDVPVSKAKAWRLL